VTTSPFDTSKLAVVYLRQSTPGQVKENVTATQEQYRLREIPERFGFPPERILVIDEDLGVSGATLVGRKGMLRVLELLERGEAACVVVRDVARLTRDEFNADIGLIARQCHQAGAKIITPEKVYDPGDPSDQLMLGLQGLLAGWDRGNIARRLEHHRRAKQARGVQINGAVPPGYEKTFDVPKTDPQHGKLRITRDPAVRERVALILSKGREFGGVLAVVRYLQENDLTIPVVRGHEPRLVTGGDGVGRMIGTGPRALQWEQATRDRVTRLLKNPAYAGAVVNGRRRKVKDRLSGRERWETRRTYEHCLVMRDAHEAYISWEQHLELLGKIARNNQAKTYGTGAALLSGLGLVRCGVCGGPMVVQYNNPTRMQRGRVTTTTPFYYACARRDARERAASCQNPAGPYIDRAASALVLRELEDLDLGGVEEALRDRERRITEESRRRQQRVDVLARRAEMLEGAIGDAGRADARARLVARFETALADLEAARAEAAAPVLTDLPAIDPAMLARLHALREPRAAWDRLTTRTRKEIIRALVTSATVHPDFDGYFLVIEWRGGVRLAAKVKTMRRRKIYPVPEDVLALFDGRGMGVRSMAARP
jgi:DNA invertase Pin-like site-specific DNA recombinase